MSAGILLGLFSGAMYAAGFFVGRWFEREDQLWRDDVRAINESLDRMEKRNAD